MRAVGQLLVFFVVFSLLFVSFEAKKKKKRGWNSQRRLKRICRRQANSGEENSALELHAFFDFTPKEKTYACLKITTCAENGSMCFVTSYPKDKNSAFNDSTNWWNMLSYLQEDRKIEPIHDSSLNGWNGDKYKVLSQYVQNQPVIYRMCLDATIYRFASSNTKTNTTPSGSNNSSSNNSHVKRAVGNSSYPQTPPNGSTIAPPVQASSNGIDPISLCPVFAKKKRNRKRKTIIPMRFLFCKGPHCPCVRICVGQGRNQTSFHDCSTFRVICTFNCTPRGKTTPAPATGSPTGNARSTRPQGRTRPSKRRKSRGQKKNRRRPRRKPKSKKAKKNNKKQKSGKVPGIGIG